MDTVRVQLGQRGTLTLPKKLREAYQLQAGDEMTLLDLDGVFILSRQRSEIDELAERVARPLAEQGESLESMLQVLREAREQYGS